MTINEKAKKHLKHGDVITISWKGMKYQGELKCGEYVDPKQDHYNPFGFPDDKILIDSGNGFMFWGDFICRGNIKRFQSDTESSCPEPIKQNDSEIMESIAVEVTDRNRQKIHEWLNYRSQEHYYSNGMITRKTKWYLFVENGRLHIMPLAEGKRRIVPFREFKDCYSIYKASGDNSPFDELSALREGIVHTQATQEKRERIKEERRRANFIQKVMDEGNISTIRRKSELNVIKYRRK